MLQMAAPFLLDRADAANIVVMGVTPEIVQLDWPAHVRLQAFDHSAEMIASVWRPHPNLPSEVQQVRWQNMPLADHSVDCVVGDGSLTDQPAQLPRGSAEDFAALARYVASATQYLRGIKEDHFIGCENKEILVRSQSGGETMCDAVELVFSHAYPVFYYHTVSAHAILMQHGVSVSKWEFQDPPG